MNRFELVRLDDPSGISGTGVVAEGIEFSRNKVAICWLVPNRPSSVVVYDSIEDVDEIHGHGGKTYIRWID